MDRLTAAVRKALDNAPGTLRALARATGVSHAQLHRIARGERNATPAVAAAVADALEQWGTRCSRLARGIRQAQLRRTK